MNTNKIRGYMPRIFHMVENVLRATLRNKVGVEMWDKEPT